jgi:hypothetical protein
MDNKELEKLFQEKLGDHGETPDPRVWDRIRSSLDEKKPKRVIPVWWRFGAAAAVLIGVLFLVNPWEETGMEAPSVTEIETKQESSGPVKNDALQLKESPDISGTGEAIAGQDVENPEVSEEGYGSGNERSSNPSRVNGDTDFKSPGNKSLVSDGRELPSEKQEEKPGSILLSRSSEVAQTETVLDRSPANSNGESTIAELGNKNPQEVVAVQIPENTASDADAAPSVAENSKTAEALNTKVPEEEKKSIFEAIEAQETLAETTDEGGRWMVGPSLAPVYFDSFGNGSPIASNFVNNSKSGSVNMSYGLQVAYKVSRRLSIRSGIHRVDYGYNTEEVGFTSSPIAQPSSLIRTISYSENSKSLVVHSTASGAREPQQPNAVDITAPSPARQGAMVQEFGYLEVPVEMQYTLIDKKWGLNVIGGMSSLFLMDNSVSLESSGTTTEVGESNNMNDLNFSTNLGFGVFYRLNPRLELNLLPMFKYQLNTFSQTEGSFRPYSIGVYSGLSFRF